MEYKDLIFRPFQIRCPQCVKLVEVSFEDIQFNEEITCPNCANVFAPNMDAQALLTLIKATEEQLAKRDSEVEKKK